MPPEIDPDAFNEFEARGWQERAPGYDEFFGQITSRLVEPLLDAAAVGPGTRMLDLATGPGYVAGHAAERGAAVVGMDIAESMLGLARRLHPGIAFRQGDAHELPFENGSFDSVVANFLVLHLGRPERAVAEAVRVLARGGRIALTAWDLPDRARFLGVFLDAVAEVGAAPPEDLPPGPDFFRFSVDAEFDALLRDRGLERRAVTTIAFTRQFLNADDLWHGLLGGTVRTSALILGQAESTRRRIREAFDHIVAGYDAGGRLELPISVKLASGRVP